MKSYATRDRQYGGEARNRDGKGWYKMVLENGKNIIFVPGVSKYIWVNIFYFWKTYNILLFSYEPKSLVYLKRGLGSRLIQKYLVIFLGITSVP